MEKGEEVSITSKPPIEGEAVLPESLRLHSTIPTQTAAKISKYTKIQPKNPVSRTGTIAFEILSGDNKFIDPSSAVLLIECSIKDGKGERIPLRDPPAPGAGEGVEGPYAERGKVLPVNGLGYAMFTNVKVHVNGQPVDSGSTLYAYRGDFETRLSYPLSMKEGVLNMLGFDEEEVAFDNVRDEDLKFEGVCVGTAMPDEIVHSALHRRLKRSKQSSTIFLLTPIHSEIFDQPKWLPPHTTLYVTLEQNKPAFTLLSKVERFTDDDFKIEIEKCEMMIRIVEVDSTVSQEIKNMSYTGNSMLYPFRRVKMEHHRIAAYMRDLSLTNILLGESELPRRIFFAFVNHIAANGSLQHDPFNYQDFDIDKVGLRVGGNERPYPCFEVNFSNGNKLLPLWALLDATGFYNSEKDSGLNAQSYKGRNCIFGFDLTSSQTPPGMCFESGSIDSLEIIAQVKTAKDHPIDVILYAEYDAEMEIQPNKKVIIHNNA